MKEIEEKKEIVSNIKKATVTSATFSTLLAMALPISEVAAMSLLTGGVVLGGPLTYFGIKKMRKFEKEFESPHQQAQLALIKEDDEELDKTIGQMTASFFDEISEILDNYDVELDIDNETNVNQFLYLINCNYYDKIRKVLPKTNRELLIRNVMSQIAEYLLTTDQMLFNHNAAEVVLKTCDLIPDDIKEEIISEFKRSRCEEKKEFSYYDIVRKDVPANIGAYLDARRKEHADKMPYFDIEDLSHYEEIIKVCQNKELMKQLSFISPSALKWDMDFLKTVATTIAYNYREEMLEVDQEFSHYNLVTSLINDTMIYALKNNYREVGPAEVLSAFKEWTYVPFETQVKVLDEVVESEELPSEFHPYEPSKKRHKNRKIIPFIPKYVNE